MKYRIAQTEDFDACAECVASTGYFDPVNFHEIGGIILLAENEDGIQGLIWACVSGTIAYSDYLAVQPEMRGTGVGVRLVAQGVTFLRECGVKQIRSNIHKDNAEIMKIHRLAHADIDESHVMSYLNIRS